LFLCVKKSCEKKGGPGGVFFIISKNFFDGLKIKKQVKFKKMNDIYCF